MVTITLDELGVNAVTAALDDRIARMGRQLATLKEQRDSPSNAFAVDVTEAAIRHAVMVKLQIAAALDEPEYPADMTVARLESESELRLAWGDR